MPPVTPFRASRDAFAFTNSWPQQPAVSVPTPFGTIDLGNAGGGLCGGMVFAALDYWHSGVTPPEERPAQGTPLYRFVVQRLIESWHVPAGIAQYYQWMNLPDGDSGFDVLGRRVVSDRGLAWRTIQVQWPQVRADLDAGTPAALGLVTVASRHVKDLALNHQVLAYGYEVAGPQVTLRIYDPNSARADDVMIKFDTSHPTRATEFTHTVRIGHPVRGFFRTAYTPAPPP